MKDATPTATLEKIFHEPNRLAIMSALCAAEGGLSFPELKRVCSLTDGNLNRHLKVLSENRAIRTKKQFVADKPRTTITLSPAGLTRFQEYLQALETVLAGARAAVAAVPSAATQKKGIRGAARATA
jgi:DNA-binding transcriptional ArsR family regulator